MEYRVENKQRNLKGIGRWCRGIQFFVLGVPAHTETVEMDWGLLVHREMIRDSMQSYRKINKTMKLKRKAIQKRQSAMLTRVRDMRYIRKRKQKIKRKMEYKRKWKTENKMEIKMENGKQKIKKEIYRMENKIENKE